MRGRQPTPRPTPASTVAAFDPKDYYATLTTEATVERPPGGHTHDADSIEALLELLRRRSDEGWETLSVNRVVSEPTESGDDRHQEVSHHLAFRRSSSGRRRWVFKVDALSDPNDLHIEQYLSDGHSQGWTLIGFSLLRSGEDAMVVWKKAETRAMARHRAATEEPD